MLKSACFFLVVTLWTADAENRPYSLIGNQFLYRLKRNSPTLEQSMPDGNLGYRWPITYSVAPTINGLDNEAAADGFISYLPKADLLGTKEKSTDSGTGSVAPEMIHQIAYRPQPQYYSLPVPSGYQQPNPLRLVATAVRPIAYPSQQYNYYDWPMRPENANRIKPDTVAAPRRSQVKNVEYVALPYDANLESIRRQDVAIDDKYNINIRPTYMIDRFNAAAQGMAMPYDRAFVDETSMDNLQGWNSPANGRLTSSPLTSDYDIMQQFAADQNNVAATVNQPKQMMPAPTCALVAQLYAKLLEDQQKADKTVGNGKSKDAGEQQIKSSGNGSVSETKQQNSATKPENKVGKQN